MIGSYVIISVLSLVVGCVMLFAPSAWLSIMVVLLGVAAIANGGFNLLSLYKIVADPAFRKVVIVRGIVSIAVGLAAILLPLTVAGIVWYTMVYMLAGYLIVSVIMELYAVYRLQKFNVSARPYYGEIIGSVILAIVLFILPGQIGLTLIRVLGALLAVSGIGIFIWQWKCRQSHCSVHRLLKFLFHLSKFVSVSYFLYILVLFLY